MTDDPAIRRTSAAPDYSGVASEYARIRPGYPPELFKHLASLVERRELALDCATGNGQAAVGLADHFERVVAIDSSPDQLEHATAHPRIEYHQRRSEETGLPDGSADLVTAAAAVHWFDLDAFFGEVRRVLRPGGVLAVWTYHVAHVEPPFDSVLRDLYEKVLKPHFPPGAHLVDEKYKTLELPGDPLPTARFMASADLDLHGMITFIMTWSGTQRYIAACGESPVPLVTGKLRRLWAGHAMATQTVRWPIYLKACRL